MTVNTKTCMFTMIIGFYLIIVTAQAGSTNTENFLEACKMDHIGAISETRSNLLVIFLSKSDDVGHWAKVFNANKHILFGFALTTNQVSLLFALRPEYGFRLSAATENGKPVELTSRGAKYGRNFDELTGYEKNAIDPSLGGGRSPHWFVIGPSSDRPMFGSLPSPDELFNLKEPGQYTMSIETACYLKGDYTLKIDNPTNYCLVKFPPVKLTVIKQRMGGE
jgi:hypothetical protein